MPHSSSSASAAAAASCSAEEPKMITKFPADYLPCQHFLPFQASLSLTNLLLVVLAITTSSALGNFWRNPVQDKGNLGKSRARKSNTVVFPFWNPKSLHSQQPGDHPFLVPPLGLVSRSENSFWNNIRRTSPLPHPLDCPGEGH